MAPPAILCMAPVFQNPDRWAALMAEGALPWRRVSYLGPRCAAAVLGFWIRSMP